MSLTWGMIINDFVGIVHSGRVGNDEQPVHGVVVFAEDESHGKHSGVIVGIDEDKVRATGKTKRDRCGEVDSESV